MRGSSSTISTVCERSPAASLTRLRHGGRGRIFATSLARPTVLLPLHALEPRAAAIRYFPVQEVWDLPDVDPRGGVPRDGHQQRRAATRARVHGERAPQARNPFPHPDQPDAPFFAAFHGC